MTAKLGLNLGLSPTKVLTSIVEDPSDVASATAWFSGDGTAEYTDAGITLVSGDGDAVQELHDKIGSIVGSQTTAAAKPVHKTNIVNGQSALRFASGDYIPFGDVLDNVISIQDKKFGLVVSLANYTTTGGVWFFAKYYATSNQRGYVFRLQDGKPSVLYYGDSGGTQLRGYEAPALDGTPKVITFVVDMSIDTNDGLDRVSINVNSVSQTVTMPTSTGVLFDTVLNSTSQLAMNEGVRNDNLALTGISSTYDLVDAVPCDNPTAQDITDLESWMLTKMGL